VKGHGGRQRENSRVARACAAGGPQPATRPACRAGCVAATAAARTTAAHTHTTTPPRQDFTFAKAHGDGQASREANCTRTRCLRARRTMAPARATCDRQRHRLHQKLNREAHRTRVALAYLLVPEFPHVERGPERVLAVRGLGKRPVNHSTAIRPTRRTNADRMWRSHSRCAMLENLHASHGFAHRSERLGLGSVHCHTGNHQTNTAIHSSSGRGEHESGNLGREYRSGANCDGERPSFNFRRNAYTQTTRRAKQARES
jgi:hypothetical protein